MSDFETPMPKYIFLGKTALHLEKQTDEHMAIYYRISGNWSITVFRNPDGVLKAIHQRPFPENIGEELVIECTKEQHRENNESGYFK